jgi:hypothetical protein
MMLIAGTVIVLKLEELIVASRKALRLWTIHPSYLDTPGLTAAWREALLASAVLAGRTVGYIHHPQLARFRASKDPVAAIETYLVSLYR